MHTSIREIEQLAERCLRGSGFSRALSQAVAERIWWAEVYETHSLSLLMAVRDSIRKLEEASVTAYASVDPAQVAHRTVPALLSATPCADFASAAATRRGLGLAHAPVATDDPSIETIGHATYRAAERGLNAIAVGCVPDFSVVFISSPGDPYPFMAKCSDSGQSTLYARLDQVLSGKNMTETSAVLAEALFSTATPASSYPTAGARLLQSALTLSLSSPDDESAPSPGYVLLCVDPSNPAQPGNSRAVFETYMSDKANSFESIYRPDEINARIERLGIEGIEIDADLWQSVFEWSTEMLAPSFEDSDQGAGYALNDLG